MVGWSLLVVAFAINGPLRVFIASVRIRRREVACYGLVRAVACGSPGSRQSDVASPRQPQAFSSLSWIVDDSRARVDKSAGLIRW